MILNLLFYSVVFKCLSRARFQRWLAVLWWLSAQCRLVSRDFRVDGLPLITRQRCRPAGLITPTVPLLSLSQALSFFPTQLKNYHSGSRLKSENSEWLGAQLGTDWTPTTAETHLSCCWACLPSTGCQVWVAHLTRSAVMLKYNNIPNGSIKPFLWLCCLLVTRTLDENKTFWACYLLTWFCFWLFHI